MHRCVWFHLLQAPYMTIYNNYSEHFEMAMATLEDCEKNAPAFSAFLRVRILLQINLTHQASGNDPCCKGQALKTLLALPLQRVPVCFIRLICFSYFICSVIYCFWKYTYSN